MGAESVMTPSQSTKIEHNSNIRRTQLNLVVVAFSCSFTYFVWNVINVWKEKNTHLEYLIPWT